MKKSEVWMRGPVTGVPAFLQPVAHALLQASEEVSEALENFNAEKLWIQPAGLASVGFHLRHLTGMLDRLYTYARGEHLTQQQFNYLEFESTPGNETVLQLVNAFHRQVTLAVSQLESVPDDDLLLPRGIGRQQIPTTVIGLLFHAAEHAQRHVGQLRVTVKWVNTLNA